MEDLSGQTFGRWLVIRRCVVAGGRSAWLCRCECGQTGKVRGYELTHGRSTQCRSCSERAFFHDKAAPRRKRGVIRAASTNRFRLTVAPLLQAEWDIE